MITCRRCQHETNEPLIRAVAVLTLEENEETISLSAAEGAIKHAELVAICPECDGEMDVDLE